MPVTTIENFLPDELYEECIQTAEYLLKSCENVFTTNRHWDYNIRLDSYPVFVHTINQQSELFFKLRTFVEKTAQIKIYDKGLMFYYWTRHSYIPWHDDAIYKGGLTIYLNREWGDDFGGYFLYEEKNEIKAIAPKKNLALLQLDQVKHCTTPVNFNGDLRLTIQAFVKDYNKEKYPTDNN